MFIEVQSAVFPFRILDAAGFYVWQNIQVGSVKNKRKEKKQKREIRKRSVRNYFRKFGISENERRMNRVTRRIETSLNSNSFFLKHAFWDRKIENSEDED